MERAARERGRRRGAATGGGQAVLAEDPRWVLTAREMWAAGGSVAPDTHSYDQLVTALAVSRAHTVKDALDVTDEMRSRGVMPSVGTYERFVAACVAANKVRMATATLSAMDDQGVAANARTYAVVLSAAAAANVQSDDPDTVRQGKALVKQFVADVRALPLVSDAEKQAAVARARELRSSVIAQGNAYANRVLAA